MRTFGKTNSMWSHQRVYDSDELHDFYVYSNLGSLAAQLFITSTNTFSTSANVTESPSAYLWREFEYVRHPNDKLSDWHFDAEDCEVSGLLTKYTTLNRPRMWVPLDDGLEGPVLITQTMYASLLSGRA